MTRLKNILVLGVVIVGLFFAYSKIAVPIYEKTQAKVSENPLNDCSSDNECVIYQGFNSCHGSPNGAINRKYIGDKDLLEKTFPESTTLDPDPSRIHTKPVCELSATYPKSAYCRQNQCAIYYARTGR